MVKSKTAGLIVACAVTAFAAAILLNGGKAYVSATAQSEMRTQLPPV